MFIFKREAKAEQAKARLMEMEAKRQEIERKREAAYQKELKERRQQEKREKEKDKPAPSGQKRPKEKSRKQGGDDKVVDVTQKVKERREGDKKLDRIPNIRKKSGQSVTKRRPLAQIMADMQGKKKISTEKSLRGRKF